MLFIKYGIFLVDLRENPILKKQNKKVNKKVALFAKTMYNGVVISVFANYMFWIGKVIIWII